MSKPRLLAYCSLLFFFSGITGLIYESMWAQYLKLLLGHAAYAQLLVLVIFMGGMALRAAICACYSYKIKHLLKAYAVTEACLDCLVCGHANAAHKKNNHRKKPFFIRFTNDINLRFADRACFFFLSDGVDPYAEHGIRILRACL